MRKATDQRDAQTISLLWTSLLLFHGGDVTCFDACHVIWCGGHVIWCDVIACVVSCHVMQCDVMWCALMWCALQWSRCVFEVVLWQCGDPKYYSVLQSTTVYYKVLLQYYSVLQSTTPVLLCTTRYYSSTTLCYKVLLQYYSVLHSTTTYYSSTTLYYKVLLQYYSVLQSTTPVLQSTTPVLLCTTKYYSSTTLYYTVLQRTTPVLPCTTKYYSSTTLYYTVLQRTTLYYKVLLQYYSVLHSTTTYYSSTTLYYKAAFMIDPWHIWTVIYMIDVRRIWNVIYNARSNRSHNPTSPNTAPATQNESHDWSASHMKRHLQWAEQQESESNFTKYCTCQAKWISWLIRLTYETSFTMSGATGITIQLHQILRLPRKMNLMIDPHHIWNVIYNARGNRSHPPTSPDTCHAKWLWWLIRVTYETSFTMRGATGITIQLHQILRLPRKMNLMIDPHYMKRHLQCAEQAKSPSNLTKYTAPATKSWIPDFSGKSLNCFRQWRFDDHPATIRRPIVISHPPPRRPSPSHLGDGHLFSLGIYSLGIYSL